jgi:hypothetical protein
VLSDRHGILSDRLAKYRQPPSYDPLRREILAAASALDAPTDEAVAYGHQLRRLGLFLLRTAVYASAQESRLTTFDIDVIAHHVAPPPVRDILRRRHDETRVHTALWQLKMGIEMFLDAPQVCRRVSLEELALRLSDRHPYAAALVSCVMSGADELDYSTLPLPPI